MSDDFSRQVLKRVVGKLCQPLGVHGMQTSVCETLTDVLKNYLLTLGKTTASYCAHANRTEPNLNDLGQTFRDLGVDLGNLSEFLKEVDSSPLDVNIPAYPIPRSSTHVFQGPGSFGESIKKRRSRAQSLSSSEEEEYDHIPPYLPALPSQGDEEKDDDSGSGSMEVGEGGSDIASKDDIATPTPFDPLKGLPQFFRQRGFSSDFSEDGDVGSSRRNSTSEGGMVTTPVQPTMPSMKIVESGLSKEGLSKESQAELKEPIKDTTKDGNTSQAGKGSPAEETVFETSRPSIPPPPQSLTIASTKPTQLPLPPPLQSPVGPGKGRGAHKLPPPPLRLISPVAMELVNPAFQGQPPTLSRSPSGRVLPFRMPVLSPLHTPPIRPVLPPPPHMPKQDFAEPGLATPLSPNSAHPMVPISTGSTPAPLQDVFKRPEVPAAVEHSPKPLSPQQIHSPQKVALKDFSVRVRRSSSLSSASSKSRTPTPGPASEELSIQQPEKPGEPVQTSLHVRPPSIGRKTMSDDEKVMSVSDDEKMMSVSPAPVSPLGMGRGEEEVPSELSLSVSSSSVSTPSPTTPTSFRLRATQGGKTPSISPAPDEVRGHQSADTAERTMPEHSPISSDDFDDDEQESKRLSMSPSSEHSPMPIRESTPVGMGGDVITEEVATLDSGVGGVVGGVVEESGTLIGEIMQDDDIVQTIVSRGSPVSDDDVIVQSSARGQNRDESLAVSHAHRDTSDRPVISREVLDVLDQTFSSDEDSVDSDAESADSDVSVPTRSVSLGSKFVSKEVEARRPLGANVKGGVAARDSQPKRGLSTEKFEEHSPVLPLEQVLRKKKPTPRRGNRAPPLGNRPLPCSPLVVHFKRHMVPSLCQQQEHFTPSQFKTKAEMKADVIQHHHQVAYMPTPHTPSSSPTSTPSPAPPTSREVDVVDMPTMREDPVMIGPLTISIKRRLIRHPRMGLITPTEDAKAPAIRVKKLLARFGGGGGGGAGGVASTTPTGMSLAATTPPVHASPVNPRKRELDLSEIGFPGPSPAKRFHMDTQVQPATISSSSSSSSSDEEDSGSESPSPSPPLPLYPPCPQTPSSIDEEESPLTPESTVSSLEAGSGLKLTISKALLPPATVQHLGGRGTGDKGSYSRKKSRKAVKPHKITPTEVPFVSIHTSDTFKLQTPPQSRGGVASGRGSKGSRGRPASGGISQAKSRPPAVPFVGGVVGVAMAMPTPLGLQGSDTICPECGLKDDGSPMIGCDQCDSWIHWVCGGITAAPPEDQKWYCPDCRKAGVGVASAGGKKRGRKKKKLL